MDGASDEGAFTRDGWYGGGRVVLGFLGGFEGGFLGGGEVLRWGGEVR